ncbi:MAG: acyl-CoA thioesterase [Actinobacteria bacterium]|nr:acyl-CoA thioesterase [Actinomycetota bacterium]
MTVAELPSPAPGWAFRHSIRVRYQEVDAQKVVFNAHYLAYCDEAVSTWLGEVYGWDGTTDDHFDWMLVKVVLEWRGSAGFRDVIDVDMGVSRWGTTSFDVRFAGSVRDRAVFDATITYVCVQPGANTKIAVPDDLRQLLGDAPPR